MLVYSGNISVSDPRVAYSLHQDQGRKLHFQSIDYLYLFHIYNLTDNNISVLISFTMSTLAIEHCVTLPFTQNPHQNSKMQAKDFTDLFQPWKTMNMLVIVS